MTSHEQDDKRDFNDLVARCAGPDRKEQERYLAKVIMQVMISDYGRDAKLPDANALQAFMEKGVAEEILRRDVSTAMKVLDAFYDMIARAFLNGLDFDQLGLRSKAMAFMQKSLDSRIAQRATEVQ